mmetsp:Transcript_29893/g.76118  ORF Transcript_29893/g.76118 Transcript_29893/m.76118 type:complete len:715 (-) Transcript_29893:592-2736(-)
MASRNEAAAAIAAARANGLPVKPEDLALLAEADALLGEQLLSLSPTPGTARSDAGSDASSDQSRASKHLWLGNLNTKLPRSVLKAVFEHFGAVEDVVTFPGRMYAFVNFKNPEDAVRAAEALNDREVPPITGLRKLVVKFRHSKKALGKLVEGPGTDAAIAAAAAAAAALAAQAQEEKEASAGERAPSKTASRLSIESSNAGGAAPLLAPTTESLGSDEGSSDIMEAPIGSSEPDDGCVLVTGGILGKLKGECFVSDDPALLAAAQLKALSTANASTRSGGSIAAGSTVDHEDGGSEDPTDVPEGKPSRHLWLGNIPLKPNKAAMEIMFAQFGPLESVRCFPGKTFAFVNYLEAEHAVAAKAALDGQSAPAVTGLKPLAIRFQKDASVAPPGTSVPTSPATTPVANKTNPNPPTTSASLAAAAAVADAKKVAAMLASGKEPALPASKGSAPNLVGLAAVKGLTRMLDEDMPPEPAINLSNRLNPNNVHYDKELAARYKRMNKAEKEALWAQDRAMQQMQNQTTAAALLGGPDAAARLLSQTLNAQQTLAALAGAGGLAGAGLGLGLGDAQLSHLLPRVMSTGALDAYLGLAALQQGAAGQAGLMHGLGSMPGLAGAGANPLLGANTLAAALSGGMQNPMQSAMQNPMQQRPGPSRLGGGNAAANSQVQLLQHLQQQQQQQQQQLWYLSCFQGRTCGGAAGCGMGTFSRLAQQHV